MTDGGAAARATPEDVADLAERPRVDDWSLRAALVRYAQPEPERAGAVLEDVRRIEAALRPQLKRIEADGPALAEAMAAGRDDPLVQLLVAAVPLDRLGDRLAAWAAERDDARPTDEVDAVARGVARRLDELGVPREERTGPPPGARRRG